MGRNAQKRRARKMRATLGGDHSRGGRDRSAPEVEPHRGPLWLGAAFDVTAADVEGQADGADADVLAVASLLAADASLDDVAEQLADLAGADAALLARRGEGGELAWLGSFRRARPTGESGLEPLLTPTLVADAVGTRAPILIRDVPRDPRIPSIPPSARTGSLLVAGLFGARSSAPVGVLALGRREVGAFFERDVAICAQLAADLGADLEQAEELHAGLTDPRTGLLSRQAVLMLAPRELERARRRERPLTALVLEPDTVASPGEPVAEAQPAALAERLSEHTRAAELCGRLVGREIVLLLDADSTAAELATQRIFADATAAVEGSTVGPTSAGQAGGLAPRAALTLSAGLAEAGPDETAHRLLSRARAALRAAKARGGACIARAPAEAPPQDAPEADDALDAAGGEAV